MLSLLRMSVVDPLAWTAADKGREMGRRQEEGSILFKGDWGIIKGRSGR